MDVPFVEGVVEGYGKDEWKSTISVRIVGMKKEEGYLEHVRVVSIFASKQTASILLPEIGDVVLLSFLDHAHTQAICFGSLLPLQCKLIEQLKDDNSVKVMKLLSGFSISVDETKDKEEFIIKSKSDLCIVMNEEKQKVSIMQGDAKQFLEINMKENKVILQGGDELSLVCGDAKVIMEKGNITIEGNDVVVKGSTLSIDTKSETQLKSVNTKITSSNKTVVHGSACEVSADTKQDIKGAMIQIG